MICDACRQSVLPGMVSLEIHYGSLVLGGGEIKVKTTHSPEAYVLCSSCGSAVARYARQVVQAGGIARAEAARRAAS